MKALRLCCVVLALGCSSARASLDGSGSIMIIPLIAQTVSYTSEITVRNPYSFSLPIAVFYTGATITSAAGLRTCTPLSVPAFSTVQFSAGSQCSLPGGGSQFGLVTLVESSTAPAAFQAFSRTQTPGGNGFSVPAYPAGSIEAPYWGHYAVGLKRQAGAPIYQSNCFVASTDDPTPYEIRLLDSGGNQLGNSLSGSLLPYQMVRYLDVFAAAGLPAGDYSNVTAEFTAGASPTAALISFCTVQESTFFGADFRMAQPVETRDGSRQRLQSWVANPHNFVSAFSMTRHELAIRHPDRVRCLITSTSAAVLEIRIVAPDSTIVAGGNNLSDTGTFYTGNRSAYGGFSNLWHLDVSPRETYGGPFPVFYDYACYTGNGSGTNLIPEAKPDEF